MTPKNTKHPDPLKHMILWGIGSGTILSLLFMLFMGTVGIVETLQNLMMPEAWFFAFFTGGLPGAGLGLLTGVLLWFIAQSFPMPFTKPAMQKFKIRVYAAIGLTTSIAGYLLIIGFLGNNLRFVSAPHWIFPPLIAGIASAYAAHRYLFRLRLWSEAQYGEQKEKLKNSERLADNLIEEDDDESETEGQKR